MLMILLLGATLMFMWYLGAFRRITFQKGTLGPFTFVYKTVQGPYSKVGSHFQAVVKSLTEHDMDNVSTAGIYYDDPETTNHPRSAVGFLVKKEQDWSHVFEKEKKEWNVMNISETPTMVSSFPLKWTSLSCALSAIKTYPAFRKEKELFATMKSGTMEIYSSHDGLIETHFPQNNFDQFNPQARDWSTKMD